MTTFNLIFLNPLAYSLVLALIAWLLERRRLNRQENPSRSPILGTRVNEAPPISQLRLTLGERAALALAARQCWSMSPYPQLEWDFWLLDNPGQRYPVEGLSLRWRPEASERSWVELSLLLEAERPMLVVPSQGLLCGCAVKNTVRVLLGLREVTSRGTWRYHCSVLSCHPDSDQCLESPPRDGRGAVLASVTSPPQRVRSPRPSVARRHGANPIPAGGALYFFSDSGELIPIPHYVLQGDPAGIVGGILTATSPWLEGAKGILLRATDLHRGPSPTHACRIRIDKLLTSFADHHRYRFVGPMGEPVALDFAAFKASLLADAPGDLPPVKFDQEGGFRLANDGE